MSLSSGRAQWSSESSMDSTDDSENENSNNATARFGYESSETTTVHSESESPDDSDSDRSIFKDPEWTLIAAALKRKRTAALKRMKDVKNAVIIPFSQDKRHESPPKLSVNYYMLNDHEIDEDIKAIQGQASSSITKTSKKTKVLKSTRVEDKIISSEEPKSSDDNIKSVRIEKGKLLFKNKWYTRGDRVCVGGNEMSDFFGVISNIGFESICVRNTKPLRRMCIKLSLLIKGKVWLKPQVAP